jgi:putative sugar O-methyltransferase
MRLLRLLSRRAEIWRIVRQGRRRFSGDPRFHIDFIDQGLAPRLGRTRDDTVLLTRICSAWSKAMARQPFAVETFQPHPWWRAIQRAKLEPVTRALAARDYDSLRSMYRNFFRDPCGAGVSGMAFGKATWGSAIGASSKQLQLIDALHRIDLWNSRTARRWELADLKTPEIGNPFGSVVNGVFVRTGCEDQHYCAQKIIDLAGSRRTPVVAEIGGGFGGMAYYLIRDHPGVTYADFDLPETIALASYYLLSAFPDLKATLYGEAELSAQTLESSRIILMPSFEITKMPASSVDLTFNARLLFDLSPKSLHDYLTEIARTTRGYVLHLNRKEPSVAAHAWFQANAPQFELIQREPSNWNDARTLHPNEMEYLYRRRSAVQLPSELDRPAC